MIFFCRVPPHLQAGRWVPEVTVSPIGFPLVKEGVKRTTQYIRITSVSPHTGSIEGGNKLTINGEGFPISVAELKHFVITLGHTVLEASSFSLVSTTKLILITPPKGTSNDGKIKIVEKRFHLIAINHDFDYESDLTVKIKTISIHNGSPVKKQPLVITGTNFGSDTSQLTVWLVQQLPKGSKITPKKYELNVVSVV